MPFSLLRLEASQLREIAQSRVPQEFALRTEEHALPPAFVATRALEMLDVGQPALWASTYLIVRTPDERIVGGCGFKTVPKDGRVEIGYGVAPACRNQGAASAAVRLLVQAAFDGGAGEVLAEVSPENLASTAVVRRAGFVRAGSRHDAEGDYVVQWVRRLHLS
jgi:[ribosomal protein S5]-alanine N-acetyltransferase